MHRKSLMLVLGTVCISGAAYFTLHAAHASPAFAEKRAEGPAGPSDLTEITALARSRDGHMLATVNDNKTVALWDASTGTNLRALESSATEWVYAPAFSPDGSVLATPSSTQAFKSDGHLLLWDPSTGQRLASVDDLSWPLCCASFNPAGTLIVVAGHLTLYLVDPSTRQVIRRAEMDHVVNGMIQAIEFNPSGDLLATAKRNGKVELWQMPDLTLARAFSVGRSLRPAPLSPDDAPADPQAMSVTFAHNLPRLAANTSEGSAFVWDLNTGEAIVRYAYDYSGTNGNSSVFAPLANSLSFTLDDAWLLTIDQQTEGIRLLGAKRQKQTGNLLTIPRNSEMKALNVSLSDGSVAFAYRVFYPGEPRPPSARFEIWSLHLR
jgi:WD40 repeat protein